jgi:hypothetical protein
MASEGFFVCVNCNRAWHAEAQKEYYVRLREEDRWFVFCADDANCPAVWALDHPEDRDVAARARAQLSRRRFRRY